MRKSYLHLFLALFAMVCFAGCREDELLMPEEAIRGNDIPVEFNVEIVNNADTRGILNESKREFANSELIHIRAEFKCQERTEQDNVVKERTDVVYTILQCTSNSYANDPDNGRYNVKWNIYSGQPALIWPNDAVTANFTAYYISGSTGALSGNAMAPKLLSDYKAAEIPMLAEVKDVKYGEAVRLPMIRLFSFLTLTEMQEGISNDMWFSVPASDGVTLNNAFRILFDPDTKMITHEFSRIASEEYKDDNGTGLVFVKSHKPEILEDEEDDGSAVGISFFLEPKVYHKFNILYPRTRDKYATYLTYNGDLARVLKSEYKDRDDADRNPDGAFLPNGRYVFSILKSLGVIVDETPDDGWDQSEPTVNIDVEKFLRAAEKGSDYFEPDPETGEEVQILESTSDGSRLLCNVSFNDEYYDVFAPDNFRPSLHNTFDGNYHYIYDMACPLFFENHGNIINLGIRKAATNSDKPIISCEKTERYDSTFDMSFNGIVASRNFGMVDNIRVIDVDMTVKIQTTNDNVQEAHNVSLLFGDNQGRVYDVGLAGKFNLTVENADGVTAMPKVMIGGIAGQNPGIIRGISYIEDEKEAFDMPEITITNKCQGDYGSYMVGGLVGNNTGDIEEVFIHSIEVDSRASLGLFSYVGGIVGQCDSSTSGAPSISNCIVRGSVAAGQVKGLTNFEASSYTGGVAGAMNLQTNIADCSVSVDVSDTTPVDPDTEYGQGGAFGILMRLPMNTGLQEGLIQVLSCYSSVLRGNGYVGNFVGIVPKGFGWEHYKDNQINVKQHSGRENVGLERDY